MSKKIIQFIKDELERRQRKNNSYSLRAFAKSLNLEASTLSKILAEKRPLTFENASRILSALKVQDFIKNSLLLTLSDEKNYASPIEDKEFITLTDDELKQTFKWYFYALLSALEVEGCPKTAEGLAKFLDLDLETVERSIGVLIKIGALEQRGPQLSLTGKNLTTQNKTPSHALIDAHKENIEQALVHLEHKRMSQGLQPSEFSGATIAIPIDKMPEAKRRIKEFRRSLCSWLVQDDFPKTNVYRLNIQLFPLEKKTE